MNWWNWKEWLYSSDPKWDPDNITCTVDDVEVDCETWGGMTSQDEATKIEPQYDN